VKLCHINRVGVRDAVHIGLQTVLYNEEKFQKWVQRSLLDVKGLLSSIKLKCFVV